jgi:putative ABC transport system permease protein
VIALRWSFNAHFSPHSIPIVASIKYQMEGQIDGHLNADHKILADTRPVSAGYFNTMQIPLLVGEACKQASTTNDVVVSRSFANLYLNGAFAVGHQLAQVEESAFGTQGMIRGIVGDAREEGLTTQPVPTVYSCFSAPNRFPNYMVRTQGDPMAMAETIRRRIHELEPSRSVFAIMPLQQHLDGASTENRLRTTLLSLFAATAVSLACIGLYGTLSYLGRLPQREVGVRLALGAPRGQIVARFLFLGVGVTVIGRGRAIVESVLFIFRSGKGWLIAAVGFMTPSRVVFVSR